MKLDKAKILEAEANMNSLLKELLQMTNSAASKSDASNQLLKLVQVARVSAESLLLLGIGLPVGLSDTQIGTSGRNREEQIDLEVAAIESNEVLKRNIGLDFNVKREAERLIEVANLSQARKREKESQINQLVKELDDHLAKCHVILHLKDQ